MGRQHFQNPRTFAQVDGVVFERLVIPTPWLTAQDNLRRANRSVGQSGDSVTPTGTAAIPAPRAAFDRSNRSLISGDRGTRSADRSALTKNSPATAARAFRTERVRGRIS